MPTKNKKSTWINVKSVLDTREKSELLTLIKDLYTLNLNNKTFIEARYQTAGDSLGIYKKIIEDALYPDVLSNNLIRLSEASKAVSDYNKATKDQDPNGTIELMVFYVKTGNQVTLDYGDMYEEFYTSLISMFQSVVKLLAKADDVTQAKYAEELGDIVYSARHIGWGYYDDISDLLNDYFPDYARN